jgi:hypothetical protein
MACALNLYLRVRLERGRPKQPTLHLMRFRRRTALALKPEAAAVIDQIARHRSDDRLAGQFGEVDEVMRPFAGQPIRRLRSARHGSRGRRTHSR